MYSFSFIPQSDIYEVRNMHQTQAVGNLETLDDLFRNVCTLYPKLVGCIIQLFS